MTDPIIDSYGRIWTAENFALSGTAHMISREDFVEALRVGWGVNDAEEIFCLLTLRDEPPRVFPEGSGPLDA